MTKTLDHVFKHYSSITSFTFENPNAVNSLSALMTIALMFDILIQREAQRLEPFSLSTQISKYNHRHTYKQISYYELLAKNTFRR